MMIVCEVLFLLLMLLMLYVLHRFDIMYPSIILCIVYLICIAFAMYNWDVWDMGDYSLQAAAVTALGVLCFSLTGLFVEKIMFFGKKTIRGQSVQPGNCLQEIRIRMPWIITNTLFTLTALLWFFLEVRRIAGASSGWTEMLVRYRAKVSYGVLSPEEQMPFLLRQMTKLVTVQGFFFGTVLVNNVVARGFRRSDVWLFLPILGTAIQTLLNAGRLDILKLIACILVASYILWHRKKGWNRNLSRRFIKIGFFSLVGMLVGFYLLKGAAGRESTFDPMYYISLYVGGSIKLFDMFMQSPPAPSTIWGKESFYLVNQFLSKFGNENLAYIRHLEFRFCNGVNVGNVYTALRRYYFDFGIAGVVILTTILSLIVHWLYCKVKYSKSRKLDFGIVAFSYLFCIVPMFPIDDIFFSSYLSTSYAVNFLLLYLLYFMFVKRKFRFKLKGRR